MITKERKQFSLFGDNWIYKNLLERFPEHPLVKMKPLIDNLLSKIEKDISVYYSAGFGRPSYPPAMLLKMLLLEYLYNLSDVAVSQGVCCNILFRWFCGLDIDESVPDDTTLVKFRNRLGEDGFKEIFNTFITLAQQLGYGKGKLKILDATHVFSFSRGLSVVGLLKDGLKRVMMRLKEKSVKIKEQTKRAVITVTDVKKKVKVKELTRLIRKLVSDVNNQADEKTKKVLRLMQEVAEGVGDKLGSLVDTDARWGYKSKDFSFFGYKAHLACDEMGFVTNLEVLSGEKNEGSRLKDMILEERKRGDKIEGVPADALYDSAANREYLKSVAIKAYIPSRTKSSEIDKFEVIGSQVMCAMGKHSIGSIEQENGRLHYFSVKDCRDCSYYRGCVSAGEIRKKVYISKCKLLRAEDYKLKMRERKTIERVNAWAKRHLGLVRARYCGITKVLIQAILTFLAMDLKIMIRGPCSGMV